MSLEKMQRSKTAVGATTRLFSTLDCLNKSNKNNFLFDVQTLKNQLDPSSSS